MSGDDQHPGSLPQPEDEHQASAMGGQAEQTAPGDGSPHHAEAQDVHTSGSPSSRKPERADEPVGGFGSGSNAPPQDEPAGAEQPDASEQTPFDTWKTQVMPPDYRIPQYVRRVNPPSRVRTYTPLVIGLSVLLLFALVIGGVYAYSRGIGKPGGKSVSACAPDTTCGVTQGYLADYTSGKYEKMYGLVSQASREKFSDKNILGTFWSDAHDYIVNRTAALIGEARITSMVATPGKIALKDATHASVPVRVTMESSWVGTIIQNITLPLVKEKSGWRVDWTPGLVFTALDDANDPYYHRRLRLIGTEGSRGTIYDADENPLAQDQPVYTVGVVPGQIKDEATLLQTLSAGLGMPPDQIKAMYTGQPAGNFVRIRTLPAQTFTAVQNALNAQTQNGVAIRTGTARVYPYGADTAAITGYVSVVTADDLKNDTQHIYSNADVIGRAGIEGWDEQYLRPGRGGQLVVRDTNPDGSDGPIATVIAQRTPTNGDDIHTAISIASQQAAMAKLRGFQKYAGSTVALDPTTGEVRVMASYPMYDPNDFSLDFSPGIAALSSLDHPYLNRAIAGAYPIGSVFKVITLSAALQNGVSPTQVFSCPGYYQVPGETQVRHDHDPRGHGNLTAPQALAPSCDVVYWTLGVMLSQQDPNILPKMAKAFGLGSATGMTGISKGAENPGLVPDPAYLKEKKNAQWTPTDAANLAIGQGDLLVTPVQVAQISAAIANNGVRMRPRLVTSITTPDGAAAQSYPAEKVGTLPISQANLAVVQMAMVSTTAAPSGTSYNELHTYPVLVAAKTGTAESSGPQNPKPPHSCYTAYAPASPLSGPPVKPQIAVGAVVEYSGSGEQFALPVVESILNAYLKLG